MADSNVTRGGDTAVPRKVLRAWFSVGVLLFALLTTVSRYLAVTFGINDTGEDRQHPGGDPWMAGDWLINYGGGFVRRGLFGQLFLEAAPSGTPGLWALFGIQVSLYLVVFAYCWRALHRSGYAWSTIALVCSPAGLAFVGWVTSVDGAFRKEILGFVAMALLAWARSARRSPAAVVALVTSALSVFVLAVFSWEPSALMLPAIVYLLVRPDAHAAKLTAFRRTAAGVFAAVAAAGALASMVWHGDVATAQAVCDTARSHGFTGPYLCSGGVYSNTGAIEAIGWTSFKTAQDLLLALPVYTGFIPLIVLALVPPVGSRWFRGNWPWALAMVAAVAPLYVIVTDWGRWTHILAMALMFCITSGDPRDAHWRFWNPFSTVAYVSLWGLPHWMGQAQFGTAWWPHASLLGRVTYDGVRRAAAQQPQPLVTNTWGDTLQFLFGSPPHGWDSWHPMMEAMKYVRSGGTELYRTVLFEGGIKFQYAPTSLLYVEPAYTFAPTNLALPMNVVAWLCVAATIVVMFKLLLLVTTTVRQAPPPEWAYTLLLLAAAVWTLTFPPLITAWALGQAQAIINLLCITSLYAYLRGRRSLSGVCLALAALLKPQLALFLLWGLVRREWRFTAAMAVTGLLGLMASIARYGLKAHVDFVSVLSFLGQRGEAYWANQSVNAILHRLVGTPGYDALFFDRFPPFHPLVYAGSTAFTVVLVLGALLVGLLGRRSVLAPSHTPVLQAGIEFSIAMVCFTLASPIAWNHHFGMVLPAYALAAAASLRLRPWPRLLVLLGLVVSYVLMSINLADLVPVVALTPYHWALSLLFYGAILLLGCLLTVWVLGRRASRQQARPFNNPDPRREAVGETVPPAHHGSPHP